MNSNKEVSEELARALHTSTQGSTYVYDDLLPYLGMFLFLHYKNGVDLFPVIQNIFSLAKLEEHYVRRCTSFIFKLFRLQADPVPSLLSLLSKIIERSLPLQPLWLPAL